MNPKVLLVDDDEHILAGYQRNLRKQFELDVASAGHVGLERIQRTGPYAVVVADMQMPVMNGIEFLTKVEQLAPDSVRIMLTGNADQKTAMDAVNDGHVFRFLTKPCAPETLKSALQVGVRQYQLINAERELLENTLNGGIKVMTEILALTDPPSFMRAQRLRDAVRQFAVARSMPNTWELELAAMLAPIGYVSIPASVLAKLRASCGLTDSEKKMLMRVPEIGANLLSNVPRLDGVSRAVLYQNKNYDGSGFPGDNVAGEAIPIYARILRVLQDLISLESATLTRAKALTKMKDCVGRYDPKVLESVAASFDVFLAVDGAGDSRSVALSELRAGQVLSADVTTTDGILIVTAGTRITPMLLEKLLNFAELNAFRGPVKIAT